MIMLFLCINIAISCYTAGWHNHLTGFTVLTLICCNNLCHFSQCPAGGGRVWYQEKGKASAKLSEILSRFQAAQGVGAPHSWVTAPPGRRLLGTSSRKWVRRSGTGLQFAVAHQVWITGSEKSFVSLAAHAVESRHLELRYLSLRSVNKW